MQVTLNIPKGKTLAAEDFKRAMTDPVYFVDAYGWTFDPRPEAYPHHLPFKLYDFQKDYITWLAGHIREGTDCLTDKSRDMGASWMALYVFLWFWLFEPGFQALLGSRKEDLVDNGTLDSLFGKLDYALERLPFAPQGFAKREHRTYMKLVNPMNGNVLKGESANAEFSRQGRYRAVLIDEGAFWENLSTAWTAAGDATPSRILVTTPPKRPHFAKYLRFSGKIAVKVLNWRSHPKKDDDWYAAQCARRSPEEIAQELDNNWEGSITGRVYPEVLHVRTGEFGYRLDWPLYVAHDPGRLPDPYALIWFQVNPETGRYRMLESMEKGGVDPDWYVPFFGKPIDSKYAYSPDELAVMEKTKQWKGAVHVGDQAGRRTNETNGESVYSVLSDHGIYVTSNTKANDLETRKRYARRVLQDLDANDTPGTRYALECLKNARYPDLSENSNRVTPNAVPIHDWTSHIRTALEFFAVNVDLARDPEPETTAGTFAAALAAVQSMKRIPED